MERGGRAGRGDARERPHAEARLEEGHALSAASAAERSLVEEVEAPSGDARRSALVRMPPRERNAPWMRRPPNDSAGLIASMKPFPVDVARTLGASPFSHLNASYGSQSEVAVVSGLVTQDRHCCAVNRPRRRKNVIDE